MLFSVIVDDELTDCEYLTGLIKNNYTDIQVAACCHSGEEALKTIQQVKPELVFLDMKLPGMNGFELLEKLAPVHFEVIVISGYDAYAFKSFQYNVADYLLKPIQTDQLERALHKVSIRIEKHQHEQLEHLIHIVDILNNHGQIALPTFEGLQMVHVDNIISCASDSNYTLVHLKANQKLVVSKTLGDVEELLKDYAFMRVHHSHLVNINEISRFIKADGGYLIMFDGSRIDVSRHKKSLLLKTLTRNK